MWDMLIKRVYGIFHINFEIAQALLVFGISVVLACPQSVVLSGVFWSWHIYDLELFLTPQPSLCKTGVSSSVMLK